MLNQEELSKFTEYVNKNIKGAAKKKLLAYVETHLTAKPNPLNVADKNNFQSRNLAITRMPPREINGLSEMVKKGVTIRTEGDGQRADEFKRMR
jgi:hypothetical protein